MIVALLEKIIFRYNDLMRPNPYIVQTLKYATLTLLGCSAVVAGAVLMRQMGTVPLTGRLVSQQSQGIVPTLRIEADRLSAGVNAPTDTHVIFTVPTTTDRIATSVMVGGADHWENSEYWGYCYTGNEAETGVYDQNQFFYSMGARRAANPQTKAADNDLVGILRETTKKAPKELKSMVEILRANQTCYLMANGEDFPGGVPMGTDDDSDLLNSKLEAELGTNPQNPDTDGDGIPDGKEVFITKTNPLLADTDRDGLKDLCEDKNANGGIEAGETSALVSDTDRDGLCDGRGFVGGGADRSGCPEPRSVQCGKDVYGERVCIERVTSPVYGEDMNENCKVDKDETDPRDAETFGMPDWEYKWSKLPLVNGQRQTDAAQGSIAPEIPIPDMPARQ